MCKLLLLNKVQNQCKYVYYGYTVSLTNKGKLWLYEQIKHIFLFFCRYINYFLVSGSWNFIDLFYQTIIYYSDVDTAKER